MCNASLNLIELKQNSQSPSTWYLSSLSSLYPGEVDEYEQEAPNQSTIQNSQLYCVSGT